MLPELQPVFSETSECFRSWPDRRTCISSSTRAIDAEWDRPPVRVPGSLFFSSEQERGFPFWLLWTAKEALYKSCGKNLPFVPADFPVTGLHEHSPMQQGVLRLFLWEGGMTFLTRFPGLFPGPASGHNPDPCLSLWISLAGTPKFAKKSSITPVFFRKVDPDLTIRSFTWKTPVGESGRSTPCGFPASPGEK